ncbi:hypothetical protein HDV06_001051 [Boothiomyces sp. JEL0866]|nr:hypothetical protein HDV06_001051 [Boothiomyces sp. JEL0866]
MSYVPIQNERQEINPSWYGYLSCSWLNPLMKLAKLGLLTENDLYQLQEKDKADAISKNMDGFWIAFQEFQLNGTDSPSLYFAVFKAINSSFIGSITADLLSKVIQVISPLILQRLVKQLGSQDDALYYYAGGLVGLQFIECFIDAFKVVTSRRYEQIIRSLLSTAIYDKSLRLSNRARLEYPEGKIMNLVNQDINAIFKGAQYFAEGIWIPLEVVFTLYFLHQLIGQALFVSFGIVGIIAILSVSITPILEKTYERWVEAGDKRLGVIRELLYGIKVVKYNSLENYFKDRIKEFRDIQIFNIKIEFLFAFGLEIIVHCSIIIMTCATILLYSYLGNKMSPDIIFPVVLYFGNLKEPLFNFVDIINQVVGGVKSMNRIQQFLVADEQGKASVTPGASITAEHASFVWPSLEDNQEFMLDDINLDIQPNTLVGIVGSVGCGKSSLLASIIGQMDKIRGDMAVKGTVAYCSQQPWIITGTIEQNILFHLPKRKEWLDKVVEMCGLLPDLALLPGGLQTEIGENGVNLSGGQKARVSLARAIYSDADILLLDDPLSGLDSKVGRQVFNSIKALPKTTLLVTHHLQYVNQLDHIIVLENGKIAESSSFSDLIEHETKLKQLVTSHVFEDEDEELRGSLVQESSENFIEPEEKKSGIVELKTYFDYIKALGGYQTPVAFLLIYLLLLVSKISGPIWLSFWTFAKGSDDYYLKYFTIISGAEVVAAGMFHFICAYMAITACCKLHDESLGGLLKAPLSFFDQNPIGRILNRMSKDVFAVDKELMNAVERLVHYSHNLPRESENGENSSSNWPVAGKVDIQSLTLSYASRPDYPVIKDLNLNINAGEKIGIVGRTGSGKSTLASSFFRIIEPAQGAILIDGTDICSVELKTLRKRLQMIPQDPVLFEGSIRTNLDFEHRYSDGEIWTALEHAGIREYISNLNEKLDSPVSSNGDNLSVGQRQLLCLARAILAQPKFLVMDEATASIDLETDALIQEAIKNHFANTTVLCIAHRLNTIADFDKVLVLEKGEMVEYDKPAKLLKKNNSVFSQMVKATGKNNAKKIREKAKMRK